MTSSRATRSGRYPAWVGSAATLTVLLAICLIGLGRPLFTPDEPREAEIAREMLLSPGIVPTLNGGTFVEKPPLYYWSIAGVFAVTGNVSPATARSVSVISAFLTLLIVFLWGRRESSPAVGTVAALGLATSFQFLVTSHWIVTDPMLMLFTTAALWAGWELRRTGGATATACFYGALALALWTKGLIGPVLVGAGVLVYCAVYFREALWRRFRPFTGLAVMIAATGVLAGAIYVSGGVDALREWFWINHVRRFVAPEGTGHEGPFYYYLWAIPIAVLPWWPAAIDAFRVRSWRRTTRDGAVRRYWALTALGMALLLSASATKRQLYLLPLLPPLFLFLAAHAVDAWNRAAPNLKRDMKWWLQVLLAMAFAIGPVAVVMIYTRTVSAVSVGYLLGTAAIALAATVFAIRRRATSALVSLASLAIAGAVGLMGVVPRQLAPYKDMAPFLEWADAVLPRDGIVYVVGRVDETLDGIVPFTTGRRIIELSSEDVAAVKPTCVLVQDTDAGNHLPALPASFHPLRVQMFGLERYMALWSSLDALPRGAGEDPEPWSDAPSIDSVRACASQRR